MRTRPGLLKQMVTQCSYELAEQLDAQCRVYCLTPSDNNLQLWSHYAENHTGVCIDEVRAWTQQFVRWYNHEHKHCDLIFVTPVQRHNGVVAVVLAEREAVYAEARERNSRRWSRSTRNWKLKDEAWLNPERMQPEELKLA
jgi:hypothetical protein